MRKSACVLAGTLLLCSTAFFGCQSKADDLTVYMPDGAPSLALAKLLHEDTQEDGVVYRVVDPKEIKAQVTYTDTDKNADLCVLPLTAATKLLGDGENYQMLGAVTHGNLYLVSKEDVCFSAQNISQLAGKTVGVLQLKEVPGLVLQTVLEKYGLREAVTLQAISGASDVGALSGVDYYVLGEPAASAQAAKGYSIVGDLQELYGGENGYPQAVLVAKKEIVQTRGAWISGFLEDVAAGAQWLQTASGTEIVEAVTAHLADENYATTLKAPLLMAEVLGRCGVRFVSAADCKADVTAFLTSAAEIDANMAVLPRDAFYYGQ